ncbi:MAG: alanine racemase [Chloroflexota bacterium]
MNEAIIADQHMDALHQLTIGNNWRITANRSRSRSGMPGAEHFITRLSIMSPRLVMPILKANAYGHGLVAVARHMQSLGVPYLG